MNDALENVDSASNDAAGHWASYLARWTIWNHLRMATALLGAASFTLAL